MNPVHVSTSLYYQPSSADVSSFYRCRYLSFISFSIFDLSVCVSVTLLHYQCLELFSLFFFCSFFFSPCFHCLCLATIERKRRSRRATVDFFRPSRHVEERLENLLQRLGGLPPCCLRVCLFLSQSLSLSLQHRCMRSNTRMQAETRHTLAFLYRWLRTPSGNLIDTYRCLSMCKEKARMPVYYRQTCTGEMLESRKRERGKKSPPGMQTEGQQQQQQQAP